MASSPRTYYELLGITADADIETIKRAWRVALQRTHPDHGGTADAVREVQSAWEVLRDPELRAAYDESLTRAKPSEPVLAPQKLTLREALELHRRYQAVFCRHVGADGWPCLTPAARSGSYCPQHSPAHSSPTGRRPPAKKTKAPRPPTQPKKKYYDKCAGVTVKGLPCQGTALDNGYCYAHGGRRDEARPSSRPSTTTSSSKYEPPGWNDAPWWESGQRGPRPASAQTETARGGPTNRRAKTSEAASADPGTPDFEALATSSSDSSGCGCALAVILFLVAAFVLAVMGLQWIGNQL